MIDFRYHLVSIVSIFLALAVGIVLGAGPLKEDLGKSLTSQLTQLRQDKTDLRTQLNAAQKSADAQDTYAATVGPEVLAGRLAGKTIAVVALPGADAGVIKNTVTALTSAGARIGSTITLSEDWADPAKRTFRNNLANQLSVLVKAPAGAANPDQLPGLVLSRAVLTTGDQVTERLDPSASQALDGLKAGNLLAYSPDQVVPASGAVVISAPVKGTSPDDTQARLTAYLNLARALDAAGKGAVVVAPGDKANLTGSSDPLVAAARSDADASKALSTVDDASLSMGQAAIVMALSQQYGGGSGQYGLAADAKAVVPDNAATK